MKKVIYYCPRDECPTFGRPFADADLLVMPVSEGRVVMSVAGAMWFKEKMQLAEYFGAGLVGFAIGRFGHFGVGWPQTTDDMVWAALLLAFLTGCALFIGVLVCGVLRRIAEGIIEDISRRAEDERRAAG